MIKQILKNNKWLIGAFLIVYAISYYNFFNYMPFQGLSLTSILKILLTFVLISAGLSETLKFGKKNGGFSSFIQMFILLFLCSFITALLFRDQSFKYSFYGMLSFFSWFIYFYLKGTNITIIKLETYLWVFCIIYSVVFFYSVSQFPNNVFGDIIDEKTLELRGVIRLTIPGIDIWSLCLFIALSRRKENRWWMALFVLMLVFNVFRGTRTVILVTFLISFYEIIKNYKYKWVIFVATFSLLYFTPEILQIIPKDTALGKMISLSELQITDQKKGNDNIRIKMTQYYLTEFNDNPIATITGNGISFSESDYGKSIDNIANTEYYCLPDVGYVQVYIFFGIIGLLLYLLLWYKVFTRKIPERYGYAKLYILYVSLISITGDYLTTHIIFICVALYVIEKSINIQTSRILLLTLLPKLKDKNSTI